MSRDLRLAQDVSAPQRRRGRPGRPPFPAERFLSAATALIQARGARGVSVGDIAEAADTTKMTLYRHYSSKDDLIAACIATYAVRLGDDLDAAIDAAGLDGADRIRVAVRRLGQSPAIGGGHGFLPVNVAAEFPEPGPVRAVAQDAVGQLHARLLRLSADVAGHEAAADLAHQLLLIVLGAGALAQINGGPPAAEHLASGVEALLKRYSGS